MRKVCSSLPLIASLVLALTGTVLAAPEIEVDSANFDIGAIKEGTKDKVTHVFKLKNVGDEPVRIKSVKPG